MAMGAHNMELDTPKIETDWELIITVMDEMKP